MSGIISMYISEYKKGIFDHDHEVCCTIRIYGDQPFHLDVGKLNKDVQIGDKNI